MSSEIVVNGIHYIAPKAAASKVGLGADYVSRMCREKLVDGKLVGGLWYVNETSLTKFLARQKQEEALRRRGQAQLLKEERRRADRSARRATRLRRVPQVVLLATIVAMLLGTAALSFTTSFPNTAPVVAAAASVLPAPLRASLDRIAAGVYNFVCPYFSDCNARSALVRATPFAASLSLTQHPATTSAATPPAPQQLPAHTAAAIPQPPTTVINQPVIERVRETVRTVVSGGVSEALLDARLAALNQDLSSRMNSLSVAGVYQTNTVYNTVASALRIEELTNLILHTPAIDGGTISGTTITNATISGGSVTATAFSGVLPIANGGTATSSAPTYGKLLLGNSSGTYDLVATSSLGITASGGSGADFGKTFELASGALSPTTTVGLLVSASSTFNGGVSFDRSTTTNATSTNLFSTFARVTTGIIDTLTATAATITNLTATTLVATNASTTVASSLDGLFVGRTSTTTILGSATSTFGAGVQTTALNVTSSSATSTFANGIRLSGGCFQLTDGTCAGTGSGGGLTFGKSWEVSGLFLAPTTTTYVTNIQQASSTLFSANRGYFGATATTTIDTAGNVAVAGALDVTGKATLGNASTTNISATYASSTQGFFGSLSVGNLSGFLKATAGAVATALIDLASDVTGILGVNHGGTGWANVASAAIPYGNGSSALATTTAGTPGQVLALLNGVPTWAATTTFSSPLSYASGAVTLSTSGDWTGTFDGQDGSYYLNAANLSNFGVPFYSFFSATNTNALAEGSTNKYFTDARADARINATSSIGTLTSAPSLGTVATSLSGFLKATAGVLSSALVDLASDVTGILGVTRGGTGWANIASAAIPYGNGSSALATTSAGSAGQVLALLNGVPTWAATTTLSTISGTISGTQLDGVFGSNGLLARTTTGAYASRTITGTSNQIAIANGDGVSGNPTLSLPTLVALTNASSSQQSIFSALYVGGTATTTIRGDGIASTIPFASSTAFTAGNLFATNATTTSLAALGPASFANSANFFGSTAFGATATTTISAAGTISTPSIITANATAYQASVGTLTATSSLAVYNTASFGATGTSTFTSTGFLGIGTTSPGSALSIQGNIFLAGNLVSTSTVASVFPYASSTALSISGTGYFGTASTTNLTISGAPGGILKTSSTGVVSVASAGTDYIASATGDWTGTFDGQEGSYYLNAANLTNFGVPFYSFFSATTTDALAQGSTNKYYGDSLVQSFIHASTTIPKTYTSNVFTGSNTFSGTFTLTGSNGPLDARNGVVGATTSISVLYGGTGSTTLTGILKGNGVGSVQTAVAGVDYAAVSSIFGKSWEMINTSTLAPTTTAGVLVSASSTFNGGLTISNSTTTNATTTNLAVTSTASTSNLIASTAFTFGQFTGFLKATAGAVATALIDLASDVTGILGVNHGGTGWSAIQLGAIPYGDGSSALATTTSGTPGQVLALLNGVPTWAATSTLSTISGTLGLTSGGTATTTFYNGGVVFSDGTKLTQSAATANFFWDETNKRLGIGTASPGEKLDVSGNVNIGGTSDANNRYINMSNTGGTAIIGLAKALGQFLPDAGNGDLVIGVKDADNILFGNAGQSGNAEWMRITSSGNVGIANTSPTYKLDVTGLGHFTGLVDAANFVATSTSATSTFAGQLAVGSNALNVLANGNVGIGTASPKSKLHVASGEISLDNNQGLNFYKADGSSAAGQIYADTSDHLQIVANGGKRVKVTGTTELASGSNLILQNYNSSIQFDKSDGTEAFWQIFSDNASGAYAGANGLAIFGGTSATTKLAIAADGNIGINTTSPTYKLDVSGLGHFTGLVDAANFVATSSTATSTFAGGITGPSNFVVQSSSGNVGIGTINPGNPLQILGASSDSIGLASADLVRLAGNSTAALHFGSTVSSPFGQWIQSGASSNPGTTYPLLLNPLGGNVGIGTTNPATRIDIDDQTGDSSFLPLLTLRQGVNASNIGSAILLRNRDSNRGLIIQGGIGADGQAVGQFAVETGYSTTTAMTINSTGSVGIASSTPWRTLSVTGTVGFDGLTNDTADQKTLCLTAQNEVVSNSGSTCITSSQRFKNTIAPLDDASGLAEILNLNPVSFHYNDNVGIPGEQVGFIAEQMLQVDPRLVVLDASGTPFTVRYEQLTSVLAKAIQQLATKLTDLATTVASFAESFTTKELVATNGTFHTLRSDTLSTDELCVGSTCVTEADFMAVFSPAAAAATPISVLSPASNIRDPEPPISVSSSTPEVASSTADAIPPEPANDNSLPLDATAAPEAANDNPAPTDVSAISTPDVTEPANDNTPSDSPAPSPDPTVTVPASDNSPTPDGMTVTSGS